MKSLAWQTTRYENYKISAATDEAVVADCVRDPVASMNCPLRLIESAG